MNTPRIYLNEIIDDALYVMKPMENSKMEKGNQMSKKRKLSVSEDDEITDGSLVWAKFGTKFWPAVVLREQTIQKPLKPGFLWVY